MVKHILLGTTTCMLHFLTIYANIDEWRIYQLAYGAVQRQSVVLGTTLLNDIIPVYLI